MTGPEIGLQKSEKTTPQTLQLDECWKLLEECSAEIDRKTASMNGTIRVGRSDNDLGIYLAELKAKIMTARSYNIYELEDQQKFVNAMKDIGKFIGRNTDAEAFDSDLKRSIRKLFNWIMEHLQMVRGPSWVRMPKVSKVVKLAEKTIESKSPKV